jgi:prepilin-type N-terminal cleavage/methylation domain-containing protein/prepilin-type processing-associated H-X9-DG protein
MRIFPMKSANVCKSRKAFTLIELLVVVAIITLLAAILFPVFDRAQEMALRSSCQSNLKQIGLAVAQYVGDFDDTYPAMATAGTLGTGSSVSSLTGPFWHELIEPYSQKSGAESVFYCPTAGSGKTRAAGYGWNVAGTAPYSQTGTACNTGSGPYQHTGNGFGFFSGKVAREWCTPSKSALKASTVQEPANTIMVVDPPSNGYAGAGLLAVGFVGAGSAGSGTSEATRASHAPVLHGGQVGPFSGGIRTPQPGGGGNYLYADGHVKWHEATMMVGSRKWNVDKTVDIGVLRD